MTSYHPGVLMSMLLHKGSTDHFQFFTPNQRKVTPIDSIVTAVVGQMQPQLGIWKRFITSLFVGGQMQLRLGIWKMFIPSLLVGGQNQLRLGFGRGLLEVY